jgi:hypothetical protein
MMQLFADLQSLRDGNLVVTSLDFLKSGTVLSDDLAHPVVLVEDEEGQSCWGYVESWRGRLVEIRLDLSTWRSEDDFDIPTSMFGTQLDYLATAGPAPSASPHRTAAPLLQQAS